MIPVDVEALILADAIGALDAEERDALEGRLETLAWTERVQVAELYDVAVEIAVSVTQVDPPSPLRARLLTEARSDEAAPAREAPHDTGCSISAAPEVGSPKHDANAPTALDRSAVGQRRLVAPLQHGVLGKAP